MVVKKKVKKKILASYWEKRNVRVVKGLLISLVVFLLSVVFHEIVDPLSPLGVFFGFVKIISGSLVLLFILVEFIVYALRTNNVSPKPIQAKKRKVQKKVVAKKKKVSKKK